jgi:hypothetical protein
VTFSANKSRGLWPGRAILRRFLGNALRSGGCFAGSRREKKSENRRPWIGRQRDGQIKGAFFSIFFIPRDLNEADRSNRMRMPPQFSAMLAPPRGYVMDPSDEAPFVLASANKEADCGRIYSKNSRLKRAKTIERNLLLTPCSSLSGTWHGRKAVSPDWAVMTVAIGGGCVASSPVDSHFRPALPKNEKIELNQLERNLIWKGRDIRNSGCYWLREMRLIFDWIRS